jgi:hypothetical protein
MIMRFLLSINNASKVIVAIFIVGIVAGFLLAKGA